MTSFRYRKPGYVALNVTNLDRSVPFYRDLLGLQLEERQGGAAFFRCGDDHHNLILYQSGDPGIKRMAFQLESVDDLAHARARIAQQGWPLNELSDAEAASLHQGKAFRFQFPGCALTFEFYASIARMGTPYVPTVAKIQRLGHVVIGVRNPEQVLEALTETLNFRVSDFFGDQVTFLRCFPNPYHHTFGVARADHEKLHHVNFMVSDVDDIGRAMNRMRKNGVEIVYGPGRHDISNSIFLYFLDPDGLTVEYSFGMEEFAETTARAPRHLPMLPEILDCWGGAPKPRFAQTGTVEQASL